jgi:hypothetical protein
MSYAARPKEKTLELLSQHADRYQAVIARMADSSLKIKALAATAEGVLVSLAAERGRAGLLLIALVLLVGLALLDAYYLSVERSLREASECFAQADPEHDWSALLTISLPEHPASFKELTQSLASPATSVFYALIGSLLLLGWALT